MTPELALDRAVSLGAMRRALARVFAAASLETPELDARVLLGATLGLDHAGLIAATDRFLDHDARARVIAVAARRLSREPVARILGVKEFWGLPLRITPEVLVPRPESETVVETALRLVDGDGSRGRPLRIADLGTGSGALLLALLHELPAAHAVGTDLSQGALAVAAGNAGELGLAGRSGWVACDFGAALTGGFDLMVSNPPYVPSPTIGALAPEVRDHDPALALDGGADGLSAYRRIAADAARLLGTHGYLVLEVAEGCAAAAAAPFLAAGLMVAPAQADLGGTPRAVPILRSPRP